MNDHAPKITAGTVTADTQTTSLAKVFTHPRVVTMLFLGFSAGIPILLIFSSLSLWLREAGVSRASVTFFSWAALGYSFKFVWAPIVDKLPLPFLDGLLGRRRSWLLLSQCMVIVAICAMALIDPAQNKSIFGQSSLHMMAFAAVLLGFSSATQDIVIDAYRIESASEKLQAMMSSSYIAGYRIGMLAAGAGALYLAQYFGSDTDKYDYTAWRWTYLLMAATMIIGVITTLIVPEPEKQARSPDAKVSHDYQHRDYLRFLLLFAAAVIAFILSFLFTSELSENPPQAFAAMFNNAKLLQFVLETLRLCAALASAYVVARLLITVGLTNQEMVHETYLNPVRDFFSRYGLSLSLLLLALIGCYRISDIVLGVISNVFYQDLGFTKSDIASVVKTFGLLATIAGGFLGGILAMRWGVVRVLFLGAVLSALTNLLFMLLAKTGQDLTLLYFVIGADNLSAGLATAAFVAFLSSLTNVTFTAVQYAIFSSLMTLFPKLLGGYSGGIVEGVGYPQFFLLTTLLGVPALVLVIVAGRKLELHQGVKKNS